MLVEWNKNIYKEYNIKKKTTMKELVLISLYLLEMSVSVRAHLHYWFTQIEKIKIKTDKIGHYLGSFKDKLLFIIFDEFQNH